MLNLTPHTIRIQVGDTVVDYPPSGVVARVEMTETLADVYNGVPVINRVPGHVIGLPEEDVPCLVSAMVLSAVTGRKGVYAPDTGATAVRDSNGHIDYVTRLVSNV